MQTQPNRPKALVLTRRTLLRAAVFLPLLLSTDAGTTAPDPDQEWVAGMGARLVEQHGAELGLSPVELRTHAHSPRRDLERLIEARLDGRDITMDGWFLPAGMIARCVAAYLRLGSA